jgi:thiamine biosynthesis lipoprotein
MKAGDVQFRAMGTECHVVVHAPADVLEDLTALVQERVELLEQCWSRFRPDSELSHLNAAAGLGPRIVSADLLLLAMRMHDAWLSSNGLFDPTVLTSMTALGYDTDFATVSARSATSLTDITLAAAPGMSGVVIDADASTISLPSGVGLDPGAIGKGLAADVIADELWSAGAQGVLVNLGGDISIAGSAPDDAPWSIGVEDERVDAGADDRVLRVLEFPLGTDRIGIATSTTLKRRWAQGRRHHVIDPRTGTMSTSDLVQVTIVAGTAWQAETLATTALLMPSADADAWLKRLDITAILLTADSDLPADEEHARG